MDPSETQRKKMSYFPLGVILVGYVHMFLKGVGAGSVTETSSVDNVSESIRGVHIINLSVSVCLRPTVLYDRDTSGSPRYEVTRSV